MQTSIHLRKAAIPDSGVSEVIGGILLISVVIAAVSIVGLVLLSQATPENVPHVSFMTGNDNSNRLYLLHNGGDSLTRGSFSVVVDGGTRDDYTISDGSSEWSLGKNLILTNVDSTKTHSVAIVYNSSKSGGVVLRSATSNVVIPSTPNVNPDVIMVPTYPPVISIPQLVQNVSGRSIEYYRQRNATISQSPSTYLNFTITQPNSTIFTTPACRAGSNPFVLFVGDTVNITQFDGVSQGFRISGIGNQIWELTADNVYLNITNSSGQRCSAVPLKCVINHTMITGYANFTSNFSIATTGVPGTISTALTVFNYTTNTTPQLSRQIINRLDLNATVITNIAPTSSGFFVFQFDNYTRSVYFAGNTTKVTVAGNQVYPP